MLNKFQLLFKPPVFENDQNKTRIARVLNILLLSLIFGLVLIGFITWFDHLLSYGLSLLLTIGTWLIMRRGYVRFASITIVTGISILLAIVVPLTGGVRSTTYGGFIVVILLAGLLLGQWASVVVALFASLLGGILLGIKSLGLWEIPASTASDLTFWIVFTVYFLVSAAVLTLALRLVEDSLDRTRLELSERKRAEEELNVLYEMTMLTAEAVSSNQLFEQISHKIDEYIKTDLFSIWLLDKTDQILRPVSRHYHGSVPDWSPPPIPLGHGIIGTVADTGQAMRVLDVTKEPRYLNAYTEARSELCVPMRIGEDVIGVINMESNIINAFSESDERLLNTIASHLAIAIERLRVDDALRESEEYYRSFVEKLPIGVYRVTPGPKGKFIIANAAILRIFGIASLEEVTQISDLYVNPAERKSFSDNLLARGHVERVEYHLKRFDGKPIWGAITASVVKGKDGEVYFDCVMEDITERKQVEEALKISEERLQQAVRAASIGIFEHNHLDDTIYWSKEQRHIHGWDQEETVNLDKFFNQIHPDDRERIITAVQKAHDPKGNGFFDIEYRILRREGEVRWLSTKSQTRFEGKGDDSHPVRTVGVNIDITERKQIETELRHSTEQLNRQVYELSTLHSMAMVTAESRDEDALLNQAVEVIHASLFPDHFGILLWDEKVNRLVRHPSGRGAPPEFINASFSLGEGIVGSVMASGEIRLVPDVREAPDYIGGRKEIRSELCVPLKIGTQVLGVINVERIELNAFSETDVQLLTTIASQLAIAIERLRVEDALRESEEYYRSFVEKLPIGVYRVTPGPKGGHLIANAAYLRMFRVNSLEELTQHDVASLYTDPSKRKSFSDSLMAKGHVERAELHLKRFDGTPMWGAVTASVAKGKDGEVYFDCVMEDITERKQAEEALKISEERLQQAVRASSIGIFDHDHLTDTIYWSAEQRRNYGWKDMEEPVVLDKFFNQVHPEDRERIIVAVQKAHDPNGDGFFDVEHRITRRDGEVRWLSTKSQTQFGGTGGDSHPVRTVGAVIDITERKQIETEREMFTQELEDRNAELERFNYTVSHELRSPIVTLKGFVGSIRKDLQDRNYERAEKDLHRVAMAADKMHETISSLLNLARIGRVINPSSEVDPVQLSQDALEAVYERIRSRNISVRIAPDLPTVYGDRVRLREVYENLIDNAAKHMGEQTSPQIEVGFRKDGDVMVLFVKDNGVGIDPRYHTRVFGLFDKLDAKSEGTGVGLALVKRIIETHGGKIWVESEGLGKGSTFCFTIPDSRE